MNIASELPIASSSRALSARSVMLSALMGTHTGLRSDLLIRFAELFDIAEGTSRVALSRISAADEVVLKDGRLVLSGRLAERRRRQEGSRFAASQPWDGQWIMYVVKSGQRSHQLRHSMRASGQKLLLAELREGVWIRPDNLGDPADGEAAATVRDQCEWFVVNPVEDGGQLAARLWPLAEWSAAADDLAVRLRAMTTELDERGAAALADGFKMLASVLRHLLDDPLLPPSLLPDQWSGTLLRREFERCDARWQTVFREWIATIR